MPFTEETLDFMALNRVMNSREWFHEHKDEYKRLIVSPMAELLDAIAPGMLEIDPSLIIVPRPGKSVSRLWRDTRRGPELPLYRDVLWFDLKRGKYLDYPGFWFELSPRALRWGCGWYRTEPATVAAARELILAGDPDWKRALEAFGAQEVFALEDTRYKRSRYPDAPEDVRPWLDSRSFCLIHEEGGVSPLYSPELGERLLGDFRLAAPVYRFFLKARDRGRAGG